MAFAFNPDDGPARLMRYVPAAALYDENVVAYLERETNTLTINRDRFDELTDVEKQMLLRTQDVVTERKRRAA